MKKLPPYGKALFDLQQENLIPAGCIYLYIGLDAWKKSQSHRINLPRQYILVLPAWTDPSIYLWPVRCCKIIIQGTSYIDPDYLADLVYCLFQDGASNVFYISIEKKLTIYHKD